METAMVPVYGPHPDDLDATLDDYDEHMREAAERFRAADEKALARYQARREQNVAQIEYAREQLDRPMESRLQAGVERIELALQAIAAVGPDRPAHGSAWDRVWPMGPHGPMSSL